MSGWAARPGDFVTASTQGRFLAVYRDDQLGPIGTGFVARHELTLNAFLAEQRAWLARGVYTVCLQGYRAGAARRFAAIFVSSERIVQRTARVTGGPVMPEIDDAVFELMRKSNFGVRRSRS